MPSRVYTRPIVILLSCGFMHAAFAAGRLPPLLPAGSKAGFGIPERFVPQRAVAMKRAKILAGLAAVLGLMFLLLIVSLIFG